MAGFNAPNGITTDGNNLYVADTYNNTIRKIVIATGVITLLAGYPDVAHGYGAGFDGVKDGIGELATFYYPSGITVDGGNLYVADTYSNSIRRVEIATGNVTTIAGSVFIWSIVNQVDNSSGSEEGVGVSARFSHPIGLTADGANLYVSDTGNSTIRKIALANYAVTTFAGKADVQNYSDGVGAAANFNNPTSTATDGTNLYVKDAEGGIRKIAITTGAVTTIASSSISFGEAHLTTDGVNLYVVYSGLSLIYKVEIATGESTYLAGGYRACFDCISAYPDSTDGFGDKANFLHPNGITIVGSNLYVADTGNNTIRKIAMVADKTMVTTFAGSAGVLGSTGGSSANARFNQPRGITTDGVNLYVADTSNHIIRRIIVATGEVSTVAGTAGASGSADGAGAAARFSSPDDITTDGTNLYVSDTSNNTLRKIVIATGVVTTIAGTVEIPGNSDGIGAAAHFDSPKGITTDGAALYVTDSYNNTIRKIQ